MRFVRSLCAFVGVLTLATPTLAVRIAGGLPCQGDCDRNGLVSIDDLVTAVHVALGDAAATTCPGSDAATIDALIRAVVTALTGCPRGAAYDLRDFDDFSFQRESGLGDCWPIDTLYSASLTRSDATTVSFTARRLVAGDPNVDECLPDGNNAAPCVAIRDLGTRLLSGEEIARVDAVLARVPIHDEPNPICRDVIYDACLINYFDWSEPFIPAQDYICSESDRIDGDDAQAIIEVLDGLVGLSPCNERGVCGDGALGPAEGCDTGNALGGDGCAANCTPERPQVGRIDPARSSLVVQTQAIPIALQPSGSLTLHVGTASDAATCRVHQPPVPAGTVPVTVGAADLHVEPVPVTGLVCACVRAQSNDAFPFGTAGAGVIDCGSGTRPAQAVHLQRDHDTTPDSPSNGGGLPDDPECDDVAVSPARVTTHACREGSDADCSGDESTHLGRCNSPLVVDSDTVDGPPGSAVLDLALSVRLLDDTGACAPARATDGSCRYPDYGADCLPCTDDDAGIALESVVRFTTAGARATLYDANSEAGAVIAQDRDCFNTPCITQVQGEPFDCDLLNGPDGGLRGVLVGALPVLDREKIGDGVLTMILAIEPEP
jgi:cysteine-rich repeat protein